MGYVFVMQFYVGVGFGIVVYVGCMEMKGKIVEIVYFDVVFFSEGVGYVVNQGFYGEFYIFGR